MCGEEPNQPCAAIDFDELLARCLGNLEFAERILEIFQERFDEDLDELDRLVAADDIAGVARLAHRLKGASANAAAQDLQSRVAEIEDLARQQSLDEVRPRLDDLRRQWDRLRDSLPLVGSTAAPDG